MTQQHYSWKQSPELMTRLRDAQNATRNCNIDIMTFAGMCDSEAELRTHVERYEARAEPVSTDATA